MDNVIKVGMADLKVSKAPAILTTLGLGSCVGVCLLDPVNKIGGMAHVMLPSCSSGKNSTNLAKYADTAIDLMIDEMVKIGAKAGNMYAKIAGGAQMFAFNTTNDMMRIGQKNTEACKEILSRNRIKIVAEDTGANYGRTIEFNCENGELYIRTVGLGSKYI